MQRQNTDPMLIIMLNTWLSAMDDDESPEIRQEWHNMPNYRSIEQLFSQQQEIGWTAMSQGYLALQWGFIQRRYMRLNPRHMPNPTPKQLKSDTVEVWKKKFVTELINYSIACWQYRNDKLHGALEKISNTQRRQELEQQVRDLYSQSSILVHENDRKMFRMPCRLRTKQYTAHLELWVDAAGQMIRKRNELMKRGRLDHWILQRPRVPLENIRNDTESITKIEDTNQTVSNNGSAFGATAVRDSASASGASAARPRRHTDSGSAPGSTAVERRVSRTH
jgi:hypothetical protein